jgi:hypothetical protein
MQSLNAAFEVISDPVRRAEYDRTLVPTEADTTRHSGGSASIRSWIRSGKQNLSHLVDRIDPVRKITPARWIARGAFVLLVLWALNLDREPSLHADTPFANSSNNASKSSSDPVKSVFQRPTLAPDGTPWPVQAANIPGYPTAFNDGKSVITLDNSRNTEDVFVKLVSLDGSTPTSVRHVYIPSHHTFECRNVPKGKYEIRYQDLGSGLMAKSATFDVVESRTSQSVSFSAMKITLVRITETKTDRFRISASEF